MGKEPRKFRRYRKGEAPGFNMATPRNPVDGSYATLAPPGIHPHVALMQVAAEDTHDNYLICRGYDTRFKRYFDYEAGNAEKPGIAIAKPYGQRGVNLYNVGEVYVAVLPVYQFTERTERNQNPGKAETTPGHPADVDESIVHLTTDEGIHINWMFIESGASRMVECCLAEDHPGRGTAFDVYIGVWEPDDDKWVYPDTTTTFNAIDWRYGMPYPDEGGKGLFTPRSSTTHGIILECVSLDCASPGTCDD